MTENEIYWRQCFRLQLETTIGLCRSLMAVTDQKPTVYTLAYHCKEKSVRMAEIHDEAFPYDIAEVRGE